MLRRIIKRPNAQVIAIAAIAVGISLSPLTAQEPSEESIEAGAEALQSLGDLPWYDAGKDDLRPIEVSPPPKPPERPDVAENLVKRSDKAGKDGSSGADGAGATAAGSLFSYLMLLLGLGALSIALIVVISLMFKTFFSRRGSRDDRSDREPGAGSQIDRLEQLPVNLRRVRSDLLGEARRHYEAGEYNEAIIYLYSYLLVELDKAQRIRLLRGKTNRQYLWELRESPELRSLVARAMVAFEDVFFGGHDLDRSRFEACYLRLDEFHLLLEPVAA
jgi:hypothetical protein